MITYTCDKCGKNCPEHELYKVQIQLVTTLSSSPLTAGQTVEWCYHCLQNMGLVWDSQGSASKSKPTIEELIRDIVQDKGE